MSAENIQVAKQNAARKTRRRRGRLFAIVWGSLPALGFVALIGLWWAAVEIIKVPGYLLPPPHHVLPRLVTSLQMLRNHTLLPFQAIILGFTLSVVTTN